MGGGGENIGGASKIGLPPNGKYKILDASRGLPLMEGGLKGSNLTNFHYNFCYPPPPTPIMEN